MPRQLFHSLTALFLTALTSVGIAFTVSKVLRDEVWMGFDYYSAVEEWVMVSLALVAVVLVVVAPLFALVLLVHWGRRRAHFSGAPRVSARNVARLPVVIGSWYVLSGAAFFSLDCSFTRIGGTTPFCYDHPVLVVYQPLASALFMTGWQGGGRFAHASMNDTWRGRPQRVIENGPALWLIGRLEH